MDEEKDYPDWEYKEKHGMKYKERWAKPNDKQVPISQLSDEQKRKRDEFEKESRRQKALMDHRG